MSENAGKPVISKDRTEVRLGELGFEYDAENNLLQISIYGEEVRGTAEVWPDLWESFVKDLENKMASGPLLGTLQQIREMAMEARRVEGQEERGERGAKALRPGVEPYFQLGRRVGGIVQQVLQEFEKTSPSPDDDDGISVSTLSGSTAPTGIAPPDVLEVLEVEGAQVVGEVTVLNWQATTLTTTKGDRRVIFVLYSFRQEGDVVAGIRHATYINSECKASGVVAVVTDE